jgi:predicted nuclease of predicted toxin-antitoxin system
VRIVIDMNLEPEWVPFLARAGHQAVHWSSVGRADDPDEAIMHWARDNDHVVLTAALDFGALLVRGVRLAAAWCRFAPRTLSSVSSAT